MERKDYVNDNITLIQDTEGLTFGTDALLLAAYVTGKFDRGCELGSGSGIISMLLLNRGRIGKVTALEVQEHYARLTERNAELNGFRDRLTAVAKDLREYKEERDFDIVFTNPPYMKATGGKENQAAKKNVARHEIMGGIEDFCGGAKRLLKYGGAFYAVYRPDRLADLIAAMKSASVEPKRLTMVHADTLSEPSMVLVEGKSSARSGMLVTKPLIIYKDTAHGEYSADMDYIMQNGSFPKEFVR